MPQHIPEEQPSAHGSGMPASSPIITSVGFGMDGTVTTIENDGSDGFWEHQSKKTKKDLELCNLIDRVTSLQKIQQSLQIDVRKLERQKIDAEKIPDLVQLTGVLMDRIEFLEDLTKKHEEALAQNEQLRTENKKQRQQLQALLGRRAKRKVQVPKSAIEENC